MAEKVNCSEMREKVVKYHHKKEGYEAGDQIASARCNECVDDCPTLSSTFLARLPIERKAKSCRIKKLYPELEVDNK